MNTAIDKIENAYIWAIANRPKINGFPFLAEVLKQAGVMRYVYNLPSCQCIYFTAHGNVASPSKALVSTLSDVPKFDKEAFIAVLRASQNDELSFPEFLKGAWEAGIVNYEADLIGRKVSYFGVSGESYVEDFPAVELKVKPAES